MSDKTTLARFLVENEREAAGDSRGLGRLLLDLASAIKEIAAVRSRGALAGALGDAGTENGHGDRQKTPDLLANEIVLGACSWGGELPGMAAEELDAPQPGPLCHPRRNHL